MRRGDEKYDGCCDDMSVCSMWARKGAAWGIRVALQYAERSRGVLQVFPCISPCIEQQELNPKTHFDLLHLFLLRLADPEVSRNVLRVRVDGVQYQKFK